MARRAAPGQHLAPGFPRGHTMCLAYILVGSFSTGARVSSRASILFDGGGAPKPPMFGISHVEEPLGWSGSASVLPARAPIRPRRKVNKNPRRREPLSEPGGAGSPHSCFRGEPKARSI